MANKSDLMRETAVLLKKAMVRQDMTAQQLAEKANVVYEHVRGYLAPGATKVPAPDRLNIFAKILKMSKEETKYLQDKAQIERITLKYGPLPQEMTGRNAELEDLYEPWKRMSRRHKDDIKTMMYTFAKADSEVEAE